MSERTVKCSDCDEKIKLESVKWEGYYLTCGCDRKRVKIDLEDIEDFGGETEGVWNWGVNVKR